MNFERDKKYMKEMQLSLKRSQRKKKEERHEIKSKKTKQRTHRLG